MKLIMESWRAFLQEEESFDLKELTPDERQLLQKILAVAKEEQLSEARPGSYASRARSRKRRRGEELQKIKNEKKKIELEHWQTHIKDLLSGQAGNGIERMVFKKAYRVAGCQSQEQCALLRVPTDGAEVLKDVLRELWQDIDKYYKEWYEQNKKYWEGDLDAIKLKRTAVGAQTKDVSELPGLGALKNSSLYKSLSKKLCPDSASGGISLACLAKMSVQAADFFPGE